MYCIYVSFCSLSTSLHSPILSHFHTLTAKTSRQSIHSHITHFRVQSLDWEPYDIHTGRVGIKPRILWSSWAAAASMDFSFSVGKAAWRLKAAFRPKAMKWCLSQETLVLCCLIIIGSYFGSSLQWCHLCDEHSLLILAHLGGGTDQLLSLTAADSTTFAALHQLWKSQKYWKTWQHHDWSIKSSSLLSYVAQLCVKLQTIYPLPYGSNQSLKPHRAIQRLAASNCSEQIQTRRKSESQLQRII